MMRKTLKVLVNDETFSANCGDLLLDAALMNGIDIPHDCRSGYCGTCRVRVLDGWVLGGQTSDPETVLACQCRVISDLQVAAEDVPEITTSTGRVIDLVRLAPDVVEVCIKLTRPAQYLPGQYFNVEFRGFPARRYSPTTALDGLGDDRLIRLHVRRIPHGRVSSALGRTIGAGHWAKLTGPVGSAYLRSYRSERLVLIAGGTGFAPLWAIASAAMNERPDRELVFVVGARRLDSLYMIPALCRLAQFRNVTIVPVVAEPQIVSRIVRQGRPTDHLPRLCSRDVIYAAGAPAMVESVVRIARTTATKCYADPFEQAAGSEDVQRPGLFSRTVDWFSRETRISSPPIAPPLRRADHRSPGTAAATNDGWPWDAPYSHGRAGHNSKPTSAV
jgi:NAD(P)H-flavin reductase/ferredoxin